MKIIHAHLRANLIILYESYHIQEIYDQCVIAQPKMNRSKTVVPIQMATLYVYMFIKLYTFCTAISTAAKDKPNALTRLNIFF